jgi:hypothetical protein
MVDGKAQIVGFPISFSAADLDLMNFIGATEMQIRSGAGMVESVVGQMQVIVKQDPRFAAWTDTA